MESYQEFLDRVNEFEVPTLQLPMHDFFPSQSLLAKVDESNHFKRFYGDTVVFNLDSSTNEHIAAIVRALYTYAPECFAEKLEDSTFHMTLHDLSNHYDKESATLDVTQNRNIIAKDFSSLHFNFSEVRMRTNYIINMVNTSLVLSLIPTDQQNYQRLINTYRLFDQVRELPYPFTPHITLAYYNHNGFSKMAVEKLIKTVNELNKNPFELSLFTNQLYYQTFSDMNHFKNIIALGHYSEIDRSL